MAAGRDPGEPPSEQAAWARLLRWFAMRQRTLSETEQRLSRWGVDAEVAGRLLARLCEDRLIDDEVFAAAFARELAAKGYRGGTLRLRLQARGVPRELAQAAAADVEPEDAEAAALELARRRAGSAPADPVTATRRVAAYLERRGVARGRAERAAQAAIHERDR